MFPPPDYSAGPTGLFPPPLRQPLRHGTRYSGWKKFSNHREYTKSGGNPRKAAATPTTLTLPPGRKAPKGTVLGRISLASQRELEIGVRDRVELFSTDVLIDMLARLGVSVRLEVMPSRSKKVAKAEGGSVNQLANAALAQNASALGTEEYFAERVAKGVIKRALHVLERAGKENPPVPGDEPVPKRVSRPR